MGLLFIQLSMHASLCHSVDLGLAQKVSIYLLSDQHQFHMIVYSLDGLDLRLIHFQNYYWVILLIVTSIFSCQLQPHLYFSNFFRPSTRPACLDMHACQQVSHSSLLFSSRSHFHNAQTLFPPEKEMNLEISYKLKNVTGEGTRIGKY